MGTSILQKDTVVGIDGKAFRLMRKVDNDVWQLEEVKTGRISEKTIDELLGLYASQALVFVNSKNDQLHPPAEHGHREIPDELWAAAKLRLFYVNAILDLPATESLVADAVKKAWEKAKLKNRAPHAVTVMEWKRLYLAAGRDILALVAQPRKKGNRQRRIPNQIQTIISSAIETVYMTRERKTVQDTLDKAIVLTIAENRLLPDGIKLAMPTRRMVWRLIQQIPAFDRHCARYGRTAATKKFRSVLGHRVTSHALERAEIDHTPLDMFVVDDSTGLPLGRPWLTVCIDDFTRCVLGINIGFEPPSYLTVARCLRHSFVPKATLKALYPSVKNSWIAFGVMRSLVVDNGLEFHCKSLETACFSLGIEIHYSARKTPWFKGKVERFQGTLNRAVAHGQPGTTFSNILDKDDYVPTDHAVVSLSKLKEIVHLWIVDVYHQKPHRTLMLSPDVAWQSTVAPEDIPLPDDLDRLDAILGRAESRKLTHKGVEVDGLFYNSPELTSLRMKLGSKLDVEVRIDGGDVGQIIVLAPDQATMFRVPALAATYAKGLTSWQHRVCKRYALREFQKYDPASWLEAKEKIAQIIREEFMHKKQKTRAKIARFQGSTSTGTSAPETPAALPNTSVNALPPSFQALPQERALPRISKAIPPTSSVGTKRFTPVFRERSPSSDSDDGRAA